MQLLRPVMLYAGTCKLCRWAARGVARLDRHEELALLPLDDEEAGRLLVGIPEDARFKCWWFVLPDGTPIAGDAGGGVVLMTELRLTRPVGRALRALHASALVDALDKVVARHRGLLGHLVPDGEPPDIATREWAVQIGHPLLIALSFTPPRSAPGSAPREHGRCRAAAKLCRAAQTITVTGTHDPRVA